MIFMDLSKLDWGLLSSYGGLLSLATLSIYAGSYGSLMKPKPQPGPHGADADDSDDLLEDEKDDGERMTLDDAYLFPIVGSVVLLGLYCIVKYLGTTWINWFLGWYFSVAGVGSVWKSSVSLLRFALGTTWKKFDKITVIANKGPRSLLTVSFRTPSLFLFPIAFVPSAAYHFWSAGQRSVLVTDILGLSFSHNALSLLKLDSFKTGSILLSGLFLYDIWWVFGTDVMVKVATTLDLPIKILWPKSLAFSDERGFTMLGLGDIVIPGTFVALALRYDYARFTKSLGNSGSRKLDGLSTPTSMTFDQFRKPYFAATLTAYVLGLVTTMAVMHMFGKAQPALLYLSPACILSFALTAAMRGELADAWTWSDVLLEEDETSKEGKVDRDCVDKDGQVVLKSPWEAADEGKRIRDRLGNVGNGVGKAVDDKPVRKSLGRR